MTAGDTEFGAMAARVRQDAARDRRYRDAVRHSRRVRFLRRAIPIGAAATVAGILFVAIFDPFRGVPDVSIGGISVNGSRITMELPRLTGFKRDSRPYEVTAQSASQDIKAPNIIELTQLKSRIALADRGFATVEAARGVYDSQAEKLTLERDVRLHTENGYDVLMRSALIQFKAGTVGSADPVTVRFNGGTIDASAVDMFDNGQHIIFMGPVRTVLEPDPAMKTAAPASPKEPSP
ncbi:LPS export ABC transporter periplasmic protein LptC [Alsobacter sp. SYSU M60028]|uniref:LPS export ABC transporter periplasmic protein LptC n=1 Tax=Alsobacter ponti TaxID=2962936 RepID=A0ABT1LCH3_9HYPH|nr:LPS export ABC transporter periplasmic protein LptC [Alsobacter ponti]MCP8938603.1 LPS export ABC transporter periplasmic protein LptC [Alsobacter ponti]